MKKLFLVLLLLSSIYICGCDSGCEVVGPTSIGFRLLDKSTQKDLLGIHGIYPISNVKLLDKNGNNASGDREFVSFDGKASLLAFLSPFETTVYSTPIVREFYLHLTTLDVDTIKVEFTFQEIGKKNCRNDMVNYLKVWYNDSLYIHANTDKVFPNFLKKP